MAFFDLSKKKKQKLESADIGETSNHVQADKDEDDVDWEYGIPPYPDVKPGRHGITDPKGIILLLKGQYHYYDKNGVELQDGDAILWDDGREGTVYRTAQNLLGRDATNPYWVNKGWASPCQYGIYAFVPEDLKQIVKVASYDGGPVGSPTHFDD